MKAHTHTHSTLRDTQKHAIPRENIILRMFAVSDCMNEQLHTHTPLYKNIIYLCKRYHFSLSAKTLTLTHPKTFPSKSVNTLQKLIVK